MNKLSNLQILLISTIIFTLSLGNLNALHNIDKKDFNKNVSSIEENSFFDSYILRLKTEEGENIEKGAYILLMAKDIDSNSLRPNPPILIEYNFVRPGLFTADVNAFKVQDRKFTLYVHVEGYAQKEINFLTLRNDITVRLQEY